MNKKEIRGYVVRWFYQGMTTYVVEKDGEEVYVGFSPAEIEERFGIHPDEY